MHPSTHQIRFARASFLIRENKESVIRRKEDSRNGSISFCDDPDGVFFRIGNIERSFVHADYATSGDQREVIALFVMMIGISQSL